MVKLACNGLLDFVKAMSKNKHVFNLLYSYSCTFIFVSKNITVLHNKPVNLKYQIL